MKNLFLVFFLFGFNASAESLGDREVIKVLQCQGVLACSGKSTYGGPCYKGYGGPFYDGYGGPCYKGYGGPLYDGYGGRLYKGYGGPLYNGHGGDCDSGYNGACSAQSNAVQPLRCSTLCK